MCSLQPSMFSHQCGIDNKLNEYALYMEYLFAWLSVYMIIKIPVTYNIWTHVKHDNLVTNDSVMIHCQKVFLDIFFFLNFLSIALIILMGKFKTEFFLIFPCNFILKATVKNGNGILIGYRIQCLLAESGDRIFCVIASKLGHSGLYISPESPARVASQQPTDK